MEWTDGILAHITRKYAREAAPSEPVIYGISPGVTTRPSTPEDEPSGVEDETGSNTIVAFVVYSYFSIIMIIKFFLENYKNNCLF